MPDHAAAAAAADADDRLPAGIWKVAAVAMLGSFLSQMDATVVNVSLSTLAVELHSTLGVIQWVTSGYLLALALVLPLNGWLVDRVGARRLYLWCFSAFTVASVLCGAAWSVSSLIGFRILQGMAGGLLAPMAQMMLARAAGRHMARVIGYAAVPVLLGPILGPAVAGAILQHAIWRWIFYINLPAGLLAIALAAMFLPRDDEFVQRRSFDLRGFLLLAPALVLFLYGGDHMAERNGRLLLAAGLLLMVWFLRHARRLGSAALLHLDLFRQRVYRVASCVQFLQNGIVFGTQMLLPLYLLQGCGIAPAKAGLMLTPLGIGMLAAYPSMGSVTRRFGVRWVASTGALLSLLSSAMFLGLALYRSSGWGLTIALLIRGVGQGSVGVPSISAAYSGLPKRDIPMATTTLNIVQRLGGPIATTLLAMFLTWRIRLQPASIPQDFAAAFGVLLLLHAFLLAATVRLPWTLPKSHAGETPTLPAEDSRPAAA